MSGQPGVGMVWLVVLTLGCALLAQGGGGGESEHLLVWLSTHDCDRLVCEVQKEQRGKKAWMRITAPTGTYAAEEYLVNESDAAASPVSIIMPAKTRPAEPVIVRLKEESEGCEDGRWCRIMLKEGRIVIIH